MNPNQEQLKAIEHDGGVVLKAGAGSGKTFVLINHIRFIVQNKIKEHKEHYSIESFDAYIRSELSSIVLITFTNLAAKELEIRLAKMVDKQEVDKEYWEIVKCNLPYMNVGTIHGFCLKLIKGAYFNSDGINGDLVGSDELKLFVEDHVKKWSLQIEDEFFRKFILANLKGITDSFTLLIMDPQLRKEWLTSNDMGVIESFEKESIDFILNYNNFNECLNIDYDCFVGFQGKKWADAVLQFQGVAQDLKSILEYFEVMKFKIPISPRAKSIDSNVIDEYKKFKDLNAFCKKYASDFLEYFKHRDHLKSVWVSHLHDLFHSLMIAYSNHGFMSFSDMEYICHKELEDVEVAKKVAQDFKYFIIDEFQDTSQIQYEIIERIIDGKQKRLFVVGDIKQAIYGFRGGELAVFQKVQSQLPTVLSMRNNYRSNSQIIKFNNSLFEDTMNTGKYFEGITRFKVEVEAQEVPRSTKDSGQIRFLSTNIECDDALSSKQVEKIEAHRIAEYIETLEGKEVAILYNRLAPSEMLVRELMRRGIGFSAQMKVASSEDLILSIFKLTIQGEFNQKNSVEFTLFMLEQHLNILNKKIEKAFLKDQLEQFYMNRKPLGLLCAFICFIDSLGISNCNYQNNINKIENLLKTLKSSDSEYIYSSIDKLISGKYNVSYKFGKNSKLVNILTVHASKGLEFDHVVIAGIYTNGYSIPFTDTIGRFPQSFQWSMESSSLKKFKTPQYLYENIVKNEKELSESKRLLYVACTRAVKSLSFVDIDLDQIKISRAAKDSWAFALKRWTSKHNDFDVRFIDSLEKHTLSIDNEDFSIKLPLHHYDSIGLNINQSSDSSLVIVPELSVTRLVKIFECPRKYYNESICKITQEDINEFDLNYQQSCDDKTEKLSSAERGTKLHEEIFRLIESGFKEDYSSSLKPIVEKLQKLVKNFQLIAEKQIKFKVLGFMVTGIPDLLVKKGNQVIEIWDYKTGAISDVDIEKYWSQLLLYSLAFYEQKSIKIVLYFIDEDKLLERNISKEHLNNFVEKLKLSLSNPFTMNPSHCGECQYNKLCHY